MLHLGVALLIKSVQGGWESGSKLSPGRACLSFLSLLSKRKDKRCNVRMIIGRSKSGAFERAVGIEDTYLKGGASEASFSLHGAWMRPWLEFSWFADAL